MAFWRDSVKLRPMAMTSPTERIEVDRVEGDSLKFIKVKSRDFYDHIIERWLKRCRCLLSDVVFDLVESIPQGQFGSDFSDGKSRRFRCQCRRAGNSRGFISMTINCPLAGFTANCTLEPPVSTPISLKTAIEAFLIFWYSLSVNVKAGATVILSPV